MNYDDITQSDREHLRELAKQQKEIAALPIMQERKAKWYSLNDGKTEHPLVTFDFSGPREEIYRMSKSANGVVRAVENQLVMNITNHTLLNDDRVIPDYILLHPDNWFLPYGIKIESHHATHDNGKTSMGFMYEHPITDLEADFHKLGKSIYNVDTNLEDAKKRQEIISEILGDILPVRIEFPSPAFYITHHLVQIMSMETMLFSMYDYPDLLHKMVGMFTGDYLEYLHAMEEGCAMLPNNDGSFLNHGSWGYTHSLPSAGEIKGKVRAKQVWGYTNSQETINVSPEMFNEFFFTYMKRIADEFGLISYGCCEPVHGIWDTCLSRMNNLRKLSISAWCNEEEIAEKIRGKGIVYQRKPSPNFVGVDTVFDPEALGKHIAHTVKAASGCPLEITFRDVLTVKGEPDRMTKAIQIVRRQFDQYWKP
jgi:hypothetical protein